MPVQAPQWTEFLSCPICYNIFGETHHRPISLGCGHTICRVCLGKIEHKKCPFDQNVISREVDDLPVNFALLQLVGVAIPEASEAHQAADSLADDYKFYSSAKSCIEELAGHLKPVFQAAGPQASNSTSAVLSRPMQRKMVTLVNCQLLEEEGRARTMRAARSLGERAVTELILLHQNPQQLSANLWAAVRARGCQFLGPAMQEEVLKLVLLALEDGSALSRKVLVLFAVQRLESQYSQASKTAVGHVVQLLYRASCFKVTKREEESSLMQLKDEFRTYDALRREHDSQIVQIATEAGLRISPEQWSSLLYGDAAHKSYMQSIIDKLQTPQTFILSVSELMLALQRTNDPGNLARMKPHFDLLANIDPAPESPPPSWENLDAVLRSVLTIVEGLIEFVHARNSGKTDPIAHHNTKFKTSMCRDLTQKGRCPRGNSCTFAHSQDEMERFRNQNKKFGIKKTKELLAAAVGGPLDDGCDVLVFCNAAAPPDDCHSPLSAALQISRSSVVVSTTQNSVSVPVGKPSIMPVQAKKAICQQTIYTSPTHAREELLSPRPVPMSQRAPPPHIIYRGDSVTQRQENVQPGAMRPVTPRPPEPRPPAPPMTKSSVLCLPANPYTISNRVNTPTSDSHYYLSVNIAASIRGKSPSQQLEELHRRKTELITQLNEAASPSQPTEYPAESAKSTHQHKANKVTTKAGGHHHSHEPSIRTSVADSMATALSTMAVNSAGYGGHQENSEPPPAYRISRTVYSSFVPAEPVVYKPTSSYTVSSTKGSTKSSASSSLHDPIAVTQAFSSITLENDFQELPRSNFKLWVSSEEDEFIPFEHTVVSKFGPISRTARVKVKNSHPLQVQAPQSNDTTPVTAVTPLERPLPNSFQVPSRFDPPYPVTSISNESIRGVSPPAHRGDSSTDPRGLYVATSLPTALMQSNVVTAGATLKSNTLWKLKKKVLNLPAEDPTSPKPPKGEENIRCELEKLNDKIENLKMSEDERLARELQAVELNIQETRRQLKLEKCVQNHDGCTDSEMAAQAQAACFMEQKRVQEELDRKLAEKLVLEEARQMCG